MAERHVTLMEEKQVILKRQQEEVSKLMQMQVGRLQAGGKQAQGQPGLKEWSQRGLRGQWRRQVKAWG